jgi:hypothetical protein
MMVAEPLPIRFIPEQGIMRTNDGRDMVDVFSRLSATFAAKAGTNWIIDQERLPVL